MKGNRLIPLLRRGDGSTLSLDFTAMSGLDSRFTFSRASTATFINSSGLVESAANGVARFDHDPATLAPKGLLIEGSVTNLVTQSEAFTTGAGHWTDSNITRDGTLRTSPDGTANALRITASAGNATIIRTSAIGTSAARTFSIWLRRVTGTGNIDYTQDNGANWNTQAITSSWVRYTFTHTANHQVGIRIVTSGDAIELWGAQLEAGSGASSYIPTGSGTVQRAADLCSISGSAFASFYGAPTGWTVAVRATPQSRAAGLFPTFMAVRSAADSGVRIYYYNDGTYNTAYRFGTASTNVEIYGPNNVTYGVSRWFGASVTSGAQIASSAGVQVGSTQTLAVPMDQTVMGIGNDAAASPSNHARVHIQTIKFWPRAFSVAELNAVTT